METLLLRMGALAALTILVLGAGYLIRRSILNKAASAALGLTGIGERKAALLYFYSPLCVSCKAAQGPAVRRFQEALGNTVQVLEIDVTDRPDLAGRWGILSLPTTVVLDKHHRPLAVNPGFVTVDTLLRQAALA